MADKVVKDRAAKLAQYLEREGCGRSMIKKVISELYDIAVEQPNQYFKGGTVQLTKLRADVLKSLLDSLVKIHQVQGTSPSIQLSIANLSDAQLLQEIAPLAHQMQIQDVIDDPIAIVDKKAKALRCGDAEEGSRVGDSPISTEL